MSTAEGDKVSVCANCGKGEEESGNLKACTACKLVKYCNRECQIAHRPQHKKKCKKRAAELHNLFAEPPSPHGDCPICFLRLPSLETGRRYKTNIILAVGKLYVVDVFMRLYMITKGM